MVNNMIQISGNPQEPSIDRFLIQNTIVYKKMETPQYARVIFDLMYMKNGVEMKDMENKTREFEVSNSHFVNTITGMKFKPDLVENNIAYMYDKDVDGNIVYVDGVHAKTVVPNQAMQYDFFKTLVNNKIKTEDELIVQYIAAMDAVNFFD